MVLIFIIVIFMIISFLLFLLLYRRIDDNEGIQCYGEPFHHDDIFD